MTQPIRVHSATHEGLVHEKNEDSHAVYTTPEGGVLLLVCDGMGGMGHGEIASALAVQNITRLVGEGRGFPPERLRRAVREADTIVRDELCNDGRGMPGATAVMVYLLDGMGHVAWAGDSRAYLVRGGKMMERTRDHKLVNELIAAGQLTEEEAKHSALAHVVTRALGGRPPSERPVKASSLGHPWKFCHGDTVVLVSDGVCDLVDDQEIADNVTGVDPEEGVRNLVNLSLDRGGHDNITAIVCRWDGPDYVEDEKATPSFSTREEVPGRDLRDPVPVGNLEDTGNVTEEIDPSWRPGDDEDTGVTQQAIFGVDPEAVSSETWQDGEEDMETLPVADLPLEDDEAELRTKSPPPTAERTLPEPTAPEPTSAEAENAGMNSMLVVAGVIAVAVVLGLLYAML